MNAKQFTISSTWDPRPETPETLGKRMLRNLDALIDISPYFGEWWFLDFRDDIEDMIEGGLDEAEIVRRISGHDVPLENARGRMTEVVEYGVRRDDDWQPEPAGGYSITAVNSLADSSDHVSLSAHGGGIVDPRAGLRCAGFETADDPEPSIVSYPVFKAVLKSIISAWEVGWADAYSDDLRKLWHEPHPYSLDLAWMTYLSPPLARKVTPPPDVLVERTDDGGLLMIAAEETFDTANPKHMAAARSIQASLAGLNAEMEAEADRLWPARRPE